MFNYLCVFWQVSPWGTRLMMPLLVVPIFILKMLCLNPKLREQFVGQMKKEAGKGPEGDGKRLVEALVCAL